MQNWQSHSLVYRHQVTSLMVRAFKYLVKSTGISPNEMKASERKMNGSALHCCGGGAGDIRRRRRIITKASKFTHPKASHSRSKQQQGQLCHLQKPSLTRSVEIQHRICIRLDDIYPSDVLGVLMIHIRSMHFPKIWQIQNFLMHNLNSLFHVIMLTSIRYLILKCK